MRRTTPLALAACTLTATLVARAAAAQTAQPVQHPPFHVGVTWSDTRLDAPSPAFTNHRVVMPSVVAGWRGTRGLMVEGRVGRLRGEEWAWPALDGPAVFMRTEAALAEARLGWAAPRWAMGPAQPHLVVGVLAARVRDWVQDGTPMQTVRGTYPGMTATAGADVQIAGPAALRLQASWRQVFDREARQGSRWGLDGRALELGLLLRR